VPVKLSTTLHNVEKNISNPVNRELFFNFYEYLKRIDTSENFQNGLLKAILNFCEFVGLRNNLLETSEKQLILRFLDSKREPSI
jgi:hypothetical protein